MDGSKFAKRARMDWEVASRPMPGQAISGDLHLVKQFGARVLIAVVDGIGHGEAAAAASREAVGILDSYSREPIIPLVKRCHAALTKTRGVVMSVAQMNFDENMMTWLGVGNVEGRLLRSDPRATYARESILMRGGLVGYQLPALQASVISIAAGDLLLMATDGVEPVFDDGINIAGSARSIAEGILDRHFKGNDDGLVLAARYLGRPHE